MPGWCGHRSGRGRIQPGVVEERVHGGVAVLRERPVWYGRVIDGGHKASKDGVPVAARRRSLIAGQSGQRSPVWIPVFGFLIIWRTLRKDMTVSAVHIDPVPPIRQIYAPRPSTIVGDRAAVVDKDKGVILTRGNPTQRDGLEAYIYGASRRRYRSVALGETARD